MKALSASVTLLCIAALIAPGAARAETRAPGGPDALLEGEPLYSQHKEELIVRHFFGDRRGGVYLDVGAFHWRRWSTTYYLEKHLGWTGVAVDALPGLADGWRRNRPGARFFQYIVTDHSGSVETLYGAGGLSSTHADHLDLVGAGDVKAEEFQVPTITLDELLERAEVERIDFLSMDIEQAEPDALAGFDIERYRPQLVCIEATTTIRDAITDYFDRHGYERIDDYLAWDTVNWYFAPKAERPAASGNWLFPLAAACLIALGAFGAARRLRGRGGA